MTGILVLTAVELEARGLARELELPRLLRFPFPVYERPGGRVQLLVAPVGLRAAFLPDRWAALVADLDSPLVISAGTCGALAPGLKVGDLILPESVLGLAGERLNVTPGVHAAAVSVAKGGRPEARREIDAVWTGLLLTSSEVVATPEAKAERWRATGACAVDMESAAIVDWASRQRCPSLVVRAVSDTARQPLPAELLSLVTPQGKLRTGRAVALALTRPYTIPHAIALRRGTAAALKRIARLLATLPW